MACEYRDGVPEKRHALQTRDLKVVDVPPDQESDQQVERAQAGHGPRQPAPPRAEVKPDEPHGRDQQTKQRNMCPPHRREEFSGRPGSHLPQFAKREGRGGGCRRGKEQMGPGVTVPGPDHPINRAQREARRRDHGPDDGDPTHDRCVLCRGDYHSTRAPTETGRRQMAQKDISRIDHSISLAHTSPKGSSPPALR